MSLMSVDEDDEDFKADLARAIAASLEPDITGPHTSGGTTGWNALLAAGRAASWDDAQGHTRSMGGRSSPAIIDDDDDFQRQIAAAMAASLASAEEEWRRRSVGCSSGGAGSGTGNAGDARNQATRSHPQPQQGTASRPPQEQEQSHVRISSDGAVCCSSGLLLKPLGGGKAGGLGAKAGLTAPVAGGLPPDSGPHPSQPCPTHDASTSSSVLGSHQGAGVPVAVSPTGTTSAVPAAVASSEALLSTSPGKHARTPSLPGAVDLVQPSMKRSRPASDSSGQPGDIAGSPSSCSSGSGGASGSVGTCAGDGPLRGLAGATATRDGSNPAVRLGPLPRGLGQQGDEAGWDSAPAHSHSLPERPASAASGCTASAAVALDTAVVDADGLTCTLPEVRIASAGTTSDPAHARALTAGAPAADVWDCTGGSIRGSSPAGARVKHSSPVAQTGEARSVSKGSVRCSSWPPTSPNPADTTCGELQRRQRHQPGGVDEVLMSGDAWLQGEPGRFTLDLSPGSPARRCVRQQLSDCEGAPTAGQHSSGTTAVMRWCGGADGGPRPLAAALDLSRPGGGAEQLRRGSAWAGSGPDAVAPGGDGLGSLEDAEAAAGATGQDTGPAPMVMDEPLSKPAPHVIGVAAVEGGGIRAPLEAAPPQWRYTGADRRVLLHQRVWWWLGPGQVQPGRISSIDRRSEPLLYTIRLDPYDGGRDGESVIATADCLLPYLEHGDRIMCRLPPSPSSLVELVQAQASRGWVDTGARYTGAADTSCSWMCGQLQHCIFDAAIPLVHVTLGPEGLPFTLPYEFVVPVADAAEGSGVVLPSSGAGGCPESTCMDIVPAGPCL